MHHNDARRTFSCQAWLWTRYQPFAAQVCWFRERVGSTGRRVRKIMVVALARKLLIALWRFVTDGVVAEQSGDPRERRRLFGMALRCRLQRVVPFSGSSPVPECGTVVGINSRRM